jgi:hypothetical protein
MTTPVPSNPKIYHIVQTVDWAAANSLRWAFTLSNAGSWYFEDRYYSELLTSWAKNQKHRKL